MRTDPSVLLIEDEPHIARLIVRVLQSKGYSTTWHETGLPGLAAARSTPPDVIILDLSLPDVDGVKILHELRSSRETRDVPVVITSAVPDRLSARDRELTQAILAKPFRLDQLVFVIATMIEGPGLREV
jgi:two-component system KDP operon response regulator KdpE